MPFAIASCRLVLDLEVSVERRGGFGFGWIFIPAQPEYARRPARGGATAGARHRRHVSSVSSGRSQLQRWVRADPVLGVMRTTCSLRAHDQQPLPLA
jgi:hypothetical protein